MARLLPFKEGEVKSFLNKQISTAEPNIVSVANSILNFSKVENIESKVKMYLFPNNQYKTYPLNKFLVLCSFLNSLTYRNDDDMKNKIITRISDPFYRKWIEHQYNIK